MNKQIINITVLLLAITAAFSSCKKDDPVPEEQELITTMKLNVTGAGGFTKTFIYKIENGFGTTTQGTVQIDTVKLAPSATYNVTAELYNEKDTPAENTTLEILEEQNMHLFLYQSVPATGAGSIAFSNGSIDHNGKAFNQTIAFTTGAAGSGTLTVDLLHEPTDKNGATPAASGGETDAEAIYPVLIQ